MEQFENMENFMISQANYIPQYDQQQQQQYPLLDPNQQIPQQYYPNQQEEEYTNDQYYDEYYDDDYYNDEDYEQQQQETNQYNQMLEMLTPEQQEQFQLFLNLYQSQQPGSEMPAPQLDSSYNQPPPEPPKPSAPPSITNEQFPSLASSKANTITTSTGGGLGLKKKKMKLNPNSSAFVPGQEVSTTSSYNMQAKVEEQEESYGEWDRPLISHQQQKQQQMMNQWQMMNPMGMNMMNMGGMNMPMNMGVMNNMGMMGAMPYQMQMFPQYPYFQQEISNENMQLFSQLTRTQPYFGLKSTSQSQQPKRVNRTGGTGIVSMGGRAQQSKAKKTTKKQPKMDQSRKPKQFKKKPEETKSVVKKQMVKEDQLFKMTEDFDFSSGLLHKVDETRQPLNIVFIGHVDAGKSTICGTILLNSGKVDPQDLKKFEAEAKSLGRDTWYLAYIMDTSQEERQKGKTVEVGKATFETASKRFTILDAPGHKNYVPNMLAGASQSDIACLVVSAKRGEFESGFEKDGQTREHAMLVRSLGCQYMIVVVNKMDEAEWDIDRYTYIQDQLSPFLEKTCGLDLKKEVAWCPISGITGENIKVKTIENNNNSEWYKGLTLFEMLDSVPIPLRNPDADLRIPVLDQMKDVGLFVFGKVESGIIVQGQQVTMMPYQKVFTVQFIYNADDQCVPYGKPGENVKLKVKDLDEVDIKRGFVICNNEDFCQISYELETELEILELPDHKQLMSAGYSCIIHMHTIMEEVEVSHIICKKSEQGQAIATSFLKSGMKGIVRISSKQYLCVEKFSKDVHLGSFTLRDEGRTIAIGKILRLKPAKKLPQIQKTNDQNNEGQK
eukprot:TRINITY_DN574_c0_g1_i3.p1 TRINITY_DN574_c0_g1~~TRINITY_DN574_c0_g1_i3.p1  ORF type:complete len:836 (-),score=161.15 TRINITY_DN574_c0_g1_i3:47-2554(-)